MLGSHTQSTTCVLPVQLADPPQLSSMMVHVLAAGQDLLLLKVLQMSVDPVALPPA